MARPVTEIVNKTPQVLNMRVTKHQHLVDMARIRAGDKHTMQVDYTDTYREFLLGPNRAGATLVVTSDDCCDYKCITITEVDGKFDVQRVPRSSFRSLDDTPPPAPLAKKPCLSHGSTWKSLWNLRPQLHSS